MNWRVDGCCCFSLRTGTLILGYLGTIGNLILSLLIILCLSFIRKWIEALEQKADSSLTPEQRDAIVAIYQILLVVILIFSLISILVCSLLLFGVYKEKPGLLKIYVIIMVISCTLGALGLLGSFIGMFANPKLFGNFVVSGIALALNVYFTMVVHSYRLELVNNVGMKRDGPNLPRQF